MKIHVERIPEGGLKLHFSKEKSWFEALSAGWVQGRFSVDRIEFSGAARRLRDTVYLDGEIDATVETECSRCLETARLPIHARFHYTFVPTREVQEEDVELSAEDLDFVYYRDDLVDLDPLVYEQMMLQVPMKVLCREDCRGICPHCGINLNLAGCRCSEGRVDDRLAVLKKFKF